MYKFIEKKDYSKNKSYYLALIKEMFNGDKDKLANIEEITKHLDSIFSSPYGNNAFLIFDLKDDKLISMVNFFEYDNCKNEWCLFSLFTNKNYQKKGYAEKILVFGLKKLRNYKCTKLISGIESENLSSIKLHEKIGFKYLECNWDELADGFPKNHLGFVYSFYD